jgi:glycosyltransferase involved in cell wall biosynthesis
MRLILYAYEYPPLGGGVGNALKNILRDFGQFKDLHVDFVTSALDNKHSVEKLNAAVTMHRLPMGTRTPENYHKQKASDMIRFSWQAYWYTWKLQSKHKYDFTHFFGFPGGLVSLLFRWKWRYLVSLRGIEVPGYSPKYGKWYLLYRPVAWWIWKFADRVIVNSSGLGELAQETMPKLKWELIANGVDTVKIKPAPEREKFHLFTVTAGGTILGKIKGLDYLVEGFAKLHKEYPDTRLELIGSGDLEPRLREMVKDLNVEQVVEFLGRKPHDWIEENLPKYHVLCLPSLNEGMSNAMLEGLAAGLPLVITQTGGTAEILREGINGFTVEKESAESIHQALRKLHLSNPLRISMGHKSRAIAEKMNWTVAAKQYYNIYQELAKK